MHAAYSRDYLSVLIALPTPRPPSCPPQAGLRGINLSGGQRQRLNLARCAYYNGDLVLLDNALSAVDHHTAQHIFQHCIKNMFADKATILVTHQVAGRSQPAHIAARGYVVCMQRCLPWDSPALYIDSIRPGRLHAPYQAWPSACVQVEFLPQCDKVAIMDEGNCLYFGPWNEGAQKLLSQYLPASFLLAAGGNAEQPRETKKKPAAKEAKKKDEKVGRTAFKPCCPACGPCVCSWLAAAAQLGLACSVGGCLARPNQQQRTQLIPRSIAHCRPPPRTRRLPAAPACR